MRKGKILRFRLGLETEVQTNQIWIYCENRIFLNSILAINIIARWAASGNA
jgi:hypothetical protein